MSAAALQQLPAILSGKHLSITVRMPSECDGVLFASVNRHSANVSFHFDMQIVVPRNKFECLRCTIAYADS
jgi:hypothetical protein